MIKRKDKNGFNYIEVLIVVAIVGIALIPLINLFITSFRMNRAGYYYLQANLCAQEILQLINEKKDTLDLEHIPKTFDSSTLGYDFNDSFSNYSPVAEITISDYDFSDLYKIDISVSWKEKGKKHKSLTHAIISSNSGKLLKLGDK